MSHCKRSPRFFRISNKMSVENFQPKMASLLLGQVFFVFLLFDRFRGRKAGPQNCSGLDVITGLIRD